MDQSVRAPVVSLKKRPVVSGPYIEASSFVFVTVQSTGTTSLRGAAVDLGYKQIKVGPLQSGKENPYMNGIIYYGHAVLDRGYKIPGLPLVTTARDPESLVDSWDRRGGFPLGLAVQHNFWIKHVVSHADVIISLSDPAEGLERLSALTGAEFTHLPHLNKT